MDHIEHVEHFLEDLASEFEVDLIFHELWPCHTEHTRPVSRQIAGMLHKYGPRTVAQLTGLPPFAQKHNHFLTQFRQKHQGHAHSFLKTLTPLYLSRLLLRVPMIPTEEEEIRDCVANTLPEDWSAAFRKLHVFYDAHPDQIWRTQKMEDKVSFLLVGQ